MNNLYKVVYHKGYLRLKDNKGNLLSNDVEMKLENNADMRGKALITVSFWADITELENNIEFTVSGNDLNTVSDRK